MSNVEYLVTINVPISLEEAMVDCLLAFENAQGFSSYPVYAHDNLHETLSLAEQVSGRQKKIGFQLYIEHSALSKLLEHLKAEFSGAGLRYWVMPIIEQGEI